MTELINCRFFKMLEISLPAEKLLALQKGPCSTELILQGILRIIMEEVYTKSYLQLFFYCGEK